MRKKLAPQKLFVPVVIILLLTVTFVFHLGIRPNWDAKYRQDILNEFIQSIKDSESINPQKYWYFRERYSPGDFTFNEDAIEMLQTFRIVKLNQTGRTELLYYSGDYLNSTDSVTTETTIDPAIISEGERIINSENIVLIKTSHDAFELNFLLPISEMKKANGFFDYLEPENQLLENKNWLNKTTIK